MAQEEMGGERRVGVSPPGVVPSRPPVTPSSCPHGASCGACPKPGPPCRVGLVFRRAGGERARPAPAVPSTCHWEAHEPSSRARGWEQLAAAGPLNKGRFEQPGRLLCALWPADPLGMPRPTPSTAYQGPHGGGTAGPGAGRPGSIPRGPQAPVGSPPGPGRAGPHVSQVSRPALRVVFETLFTPETLFALESAGILLLGGLRGGQELLQGSPGHVPEWATSGIHEEAAAPFVLDPVPAACLSPALEPDVPSPPPASVLIPELISRPVQTGPVMTEDRGPRGDAGVIPIGIWVAS